MSERTPIPELDDLIERLVESLHQYSRREQVNQKYIDHQNKLITELNSINDKYDGLELYDYWQHIESEMSRMEFIDPKIQGHNIQIITNSTGKYFSHLKIDLT